VFYALELPVRLRVHKWYFFSGLECWWNIWQKMVLLPVASAESWDWQSTVPVADAPTYVKKLDLDAGQLITASIHSVRPSAMPWRHTQSQVGCAQSPEDVGNIHEEDCSEVKTDIVSTRAIQPTELATRHWPGVWLDPSHSQGRLNPLSFQHLMIHIFLWPRPPLMAEGVQSQSTSASRASMDEL